jgi:predicted hotdog family 3-hydroxylacyl-ACP dehydratase
MTLDLYAPEQVLPHARPMILIDALVAREAERLVASLEVRADSLFFRPPHGVAAHVSIEWMAQCCAAWAGARALDEGRQVDLGFLLGTRDFRAEVDWFAAGERLYVTAELEFQDEEMGSFRCRTARRRGGEPVASARLSVYQPRDVAAFLAARAGAARGGAACAGASSSPAPARESAARSRGDWRRTALPSPCTTVAIAPAPSRPWRRSPAAAAPAR